MAPWEKSHKSFARTCGLQNQQQHFSNATTIRQTHALNVFNKQASERASEQAIQ